VRPTPQAEVDEVEVGPPRIQRDPLARQPTQHEIDQLQGRGDGAEPEGDRQDDADLDAQGAAFGRAQDVRRRAHPVTVAVRRRVTFDGRAAR
jgi:hypothetical protein